jgi:hypothetical protein
MAAFEEFAMGIMEVRTLLSLASTGDGASDDVTTRNNAVYRAGTVLLVSHFESFLQKTAEEFIDSISTGDVQSKAIPRKLRELYSLPRMEEILKSQNETQRAALLTRLTEVNCLWTEQAKPPRTLLKPQTLSRTVASANSEIIDNLFSLMGSRSNVCDGDIDVVMSDENEATPFNIRLLLRDVTECRNDIAHGDSSRTPTQEDVNRYIRQLETLARRLASKAAALARAVLAA